MKDFLSSNIKHLRTQSGESQAGLGSKVSKAHTSIGNWEKGIAEPSLKEIQELARIFEVDPADLIFKDLSKGNLMPAVREIKNGEKGNLKGNPYGNLNGKKEGFSKVNEPPVEYHIPSNIEPVFFTADDLKAIPIVDISVAAGGGYLNPDHMEVQGYLSVPKNLVSSGFHLCVKVKGQSMEPTLPDSSYIIIRLMHRNDWLTMRDEEIYMMVDKEGRSYVKTVKNRLNKGFAVLMSENPDKAAHPNFNLEASEIKDIWHVDAALMMRFRRVYNQYLDRMRQLEDNVEEIRRHLKLGPGKETFSLD